MLSSSSWKALAASSCSRWALEAACCSVDGPAVTLHSAHWLPRPRNLPSPTPHAADCVPGPMLGPGALSQATVGGSPGQPWDADLNKQGLQRPREGWLGARPQVCHVWEAPTIETQACHQALSLTWRVGNGGWGGSVTRQGG